jgi:hypothetical protein
MKYVLLYITSRGNLVHFSMIELYFICSYLKGFYYEMFKYKYRVPSMGIGVPVYDGTVLLNIFLLQKSF